MRDFIHICGLAALTAFLVTRLPSRLPAGPVREAETAPFVSYVTLSAAEHAARLEMARTFWQMGDAGRGHVSIGGLDSGVHLLEDAMPAPTFVALPLAVASIVKPAGSPEAVTGFSSVPGAVSGVPSYVFSALSVVTWTVAFVTFRVPVSSVSS